MIEHLIRHVMNICTSIYLSLFFFFLLILAAVSDYVASKVHLCQFTWFVIHGIAGG